MPGSRPGKAPAALNMPVPFAKVAGKTVMTEDPKADDALSTRTSNSTGALLETEIGVWRENSKAVAARVLTNVPMSAYFEGVEVALAERIFKWLKSAI